MHDANVTPTREPHMYTTLELVEAAPVRVLLDDQVLTVAQVRKVASGEWAVDFTEAMEGSDSATLHIGPENADEPLWERA